MKNDLKSQEFNNLMASNGFIPHITLATRITDTSMSIIDYIYSNTLSHNTQSGNILIEIADHLLQFLSVDKTKIEYKNVDLYKKNFKNFDEESFIHDITIQSWNKSLNGVNSKYNDFIWRLEGCVNRHAPITKLNRKEKK